MALAVSLTNIGMRSDACEALLRWLRHNPKYKQLLKGKTHLTASPISQRRMSHAPNLGRNERWGVWSPAGGVETPLCWSGLVNRMKS